VRQDQAGQELEAHGSWKEQAEYQGSSAYK